MNNEGAVEPTMGPDATKEEVNVTTGLIHDALVSLRYVGVGLLAGSGVVTIHEAREMAGLKPMTSTQKTWYKAMLKWMKDTGAVGVPLATYPDWYKML